MLFIDQLNLHNTILKLKLKFRKKYWDKSSGKILKLKFRKKYFDVSPSSNYFAMLDNLYLKRVSFLIIMPDAYAGKLQSDYLT